MVKYRYFSLSYTKQRIKFVIKVGINIIRSINKYKHWLGLKLRYCFNPEKSDLNKSNRLITKSGAIKLHKLITNNLGLNKRNPGKTVANLN